MINWIEKIFLLIIKYFSSDYKEVEHKINSSKIPFFNKKRKEKLKKIVGFIRDLRTFLYRR